MDSSDPDPIPIPITFLFLYRIVVFQIPIEKDFRMTYSDLNYGKKHSKKSKFESRITAFAKTNV